MTVPAEVVQIMGSLGIKGVRRVRCRVAESMEGQKTLTRNVSGPVKIGDVILLKETELEAEGRLQKR